MKKITTDILKAIEHAETILVCGHTRPDGDCVSSALAMRRICEKLGKKADAVCDADKPISYAFLPDYENFCAPRFDKYDLFIAVDCATDKRLGEYFRVMQEAGNVVNIDHHPTNNLYGKINYIDPAASSTCAILYDLFSAQNGLIDRDVATMLYTGLSTDTGHFMHSNTTAKVFEIAMKLSELGVDIVNVNQALYCNKPFSKLKLAAKAINAIKLYEDGKIALMTIDQADLAECGCGSDDTEGLIDYASSISGVCISIAMCEQKGGFFRVSFRSSEADVAAAAGQFGGGGHKLAAGCIVNGNRYDVMEKLIAAAKSAIDKIS
ncbi:MAG: bifunctional oligoribonuclease/PAP phosphatase NrnA [Clostridiales bacterium]|nr:bifunctional oligoribonuclease/PAP phosphatase NrnA [Clostridiales bacterium]